VVATSLRFQAHSIWTPDRRLAKRLTTADEGDMDTKISGLEMLTVINLMTRISMFQQCGTETFGEKVKREPGTNGLER